MKARQLREHGILRRENGHVRTEPGQNFPCGGGNVAAVHQCGHGHTARVERASDDEGALRNEQGLRRVLPAAELHLGQAGVDIQLRGGKFGDLDQTARSDARSGRGAEQIENRKRNVITRPPGERCRGAACRSRRRTYSPYWPPLKWQAPFVIAGSEATWRPEREARGSALGVQSRSTRLNCGKAIGEIVSAFPRLPRRPAASSQ